MCVLIPVLFFFFNDTATTEIYTLSLHDALPIFHFFKYRDFNRGGHLQSAPIANDRSEENTSELQSHDNLVCRLLLEKKHKQNNLPNEPPQRNFPTSPSSRQDDA